MIYSKVSLKKKNTINSATSLFCWNWKSNREGFRDTRSLSFSFSPRTLGRGGKWDLGQGVRYCDGEKRENRRMGWMRPQRIERDTQVHGEKKIRYFGDDRLRIRGFPREISGKTSRSVVALCRVAWDAKQNEERMKGENGDNNVWRKRRRKVEIHGEERRERDWKNKEDACRCRCEIPSSLISFVALYTARGLLGYPLLYVFCQRSSQPLRANFFSTRTLLTKNDFFLSRAQ